MNDTKPKAAREFWIGYHSDGEAYISGKPKGGGWNTSHVIEKSAYDALLEVVKIQREALEKIVDVNRCEYALDAQDREDIAKEALSQTSEMLKKIGVE